MTSDASNSAAELSDDQLEQAAGGTGIGSGLVSLVNSLVICTTTGAPIPTSGTAPVQES